MKQGDIVKANGRLRKVFRDEGNWLSVETADSCEMLKHLDVIRNQETAKLEYRIQELEDTVAILNTIIGRLSCESRTEDNGTSTS